MSTVHAEVCFNGEMLSIKQFYEPLGVKVTALGLHFERFDMVYAGADFGVNEFCISIDIDGDLSEIEAYYRRTGVTVLDDGFDASGPYITVRDPAGLRVRVGLTSAAFAQALRQMKRDAE